MKSWADDAALAQLAETWLNLALVIYINNFKYIYSYYNIIIIKINIRKKINVI